MLGVKAWQKTDSPWLSPIPLIQTSLSTDVVPAPAPIAQPLFLGQESTIDGIDRDLSRTMAEFAYVQVLRSLLGGVFVLCECGWVESVSFAGRVVHCSTHAHSHTHTHTLTLPLTQVMKPMFGAAGAVQVFRTGGRLTKPGTGDGDSPPPSSLLPPPSTLLVPFCCRNCDLFVVPELLSAQLFMLSPTSLHGVVCDVHVHPVMQLRDVLAAYVCYRPDIGYVQGMSQVVACLLLVMDAPEAAVFTAFANLESRQPHRAFLTGDYDTVRWLSFLLLCSLQSSLCLSH